MSFFDLDDVQVTQFGVYLSDGGESRFALVPVNRDVQALLQQMTRTTATALKCFQENTALARFEHAEKYATTEALSYPITEADYTLLPVELYRAANLGVDVHALQVPDEIRFYYAILRDSQDRRLVAVRRAVYFKAVVSARGRLARVIDDAMTIVDDDIFKLDLDFDYLVTADEIYILRPGSFEYTADIDEVVTAKAVQNTLALGTEIPFVNFQRIANRVQTHKRAARLVAALRTRGDLALINEARLRAHCAATNVPLEDTPDGLAPAAGSELDFLGVLDRRRYNNDLTEEGPEIFEAAARKQVTR